MINQQKLQQGINFTPHERQKEILACKNNEIVVVAGRGFGKSMISAYVIVDYFLQALLDIKKGKRQGCKIWIVAGTYELSRKVFEYVVRFLLAYDKKSFGHCISERPQPNIKFSNDVWIQCKSTTEPFGLLGERVDLEVVDEAPLVPDKIYHQYITPSVSSQGGKIIYIGTPRGKNWFKDKYYYLKEKGAAFHYQSSDGVHYTEEMLNELEKTVPKLLFRQEYLAEFVDEAGVVFRRLEDIIANTEEDAIQGHFYTMGLDIAESDDYTVMTIIDNLDKKVVHIDRFKGRDYLLQKQQIKAKTQRYNNARVVMDTTGVGRPVYEDLRQDGVFVEDFTFSGKSKEELIGKLIVYIEEKYIRIPNNPVLLDELRAFEYQYRNPKTGLPLKNIKYGAPQGYHDDCLKEGTLVKTIDGYKPIEDIKVGELVLTHKGRYKSVERLIKKSFNGDFYKADFWGQADLELSYNHPLYAATGNYKGKKLIGMGKRQWIFPSSWKKAYRQVSIKEKLGENENKILKENDFYQNNKQATRIKLRSIKLDKSFAKFLGLFLAEGHAGRMNNKDYRCSIAFNKRDKDLIREIRDYILSLGIEVQNREYGERSGAFALCFESKFLHYLLAKCYDKNREKQLPDYARYLGKDLRHTLEYWLKGDGWFRKNTGYWVGVTTSKSLALSMRDLAMSVGKYAVLNRVKRHRYGVDTKDQYWVYIYNKPREGSYIRHISKFEYGSRKRKIIKEHFNGEVYNLEVKDDKSFIANGITVHNCVDSLALAVWGLNPGQPKPKSNPNILEPNKGRKPKRSFI